MNKPLTSWQKTLRSLGFKVNWEAVFAKMQRSSQTKATPRVNFSLNVETLEERQMLSSVGLVSEVDITVDASLESAETSVVASVDATNDVVAASSASDVLLFTSAVTETDQGSIAVGESVSGDVQGDEVDVYTFAGTAGESIAADFTIGGPGIEIEIVGPDGEVLEPQFVSFSELSFDGSGIRDLEVTGEYQLRVSIPQDDFGPGDEFGPGDVFDPGDDFGLGDEFGPDDEFGLVLSSVQEGAPAVSYEIALSSVTPPDVATIAVGDLSLIHI